MIPTEPLVSAELCSASTPYKATSWSSKNSWIDPIKFEPPPMHATIASGSLFSFSKICFLISFPIIDCANCTIFGKGWGPIAEPQQ